MYRHEMICKTLHSGKKHVIKSVQHIYVNAHNLSLPLKCIHMDFEKGVTKLRTALPIKMEKEIGIAGMVSKKTLVLSEMFKLLYTWRTCYMLLK